MWKKYGNLWENASKMMPKRGPKSMTNQWIFWTCDFLFFVKSIKLKSFFHGSRTESGSFRWRDSRERSEKKEEGVGGGGAGAQGHLACFGSFWQQKALKDWCLQNLRIYMSEYRPGDTKLCVLSDHFGHIFNEKKLSEKASEFIP